METGVSFLIRYKFLISLLAFLVGVFSASFFHFGFGFISFLLFIGFIFLIYSFRLQGYSRRIFLICSLSIVLFSSGILRYELKNNQEVNTDLRSSVGRAISIDGIVQSEPQSKESYRQYIIQPAEGKEKILVRADLYPEFQYGDEIKFNGKLSLPENFETDSGKEFDYISYLKKDDISYILSFAKGELISVGNGNEVKSLLYKVKNKFLQNLNSSISEPESSLLAGILLGVDSLGKDLEEAFRRTGIVHIIVLSGYNITIVAESLIKFFSFLPKNFALGTGAFGIILFAIMVGGTPSVLRASLMALLVLLARSTGRTYDIGRALLIAGFCMVLSNPNILVFDTSFQLSFLSTLALIFISPIIEKKLTWIPEKLGLRDITSATISTQIFVLPLLLYKMGELSLVGLPVNLLVLGFVPGIMLLGFITGLFGFTSHLIAIPFAFVTELLLSYVLKVVDIFASLLFASIHIPFFSTFLFWIAYILYGFFFWKISRKNSMISSTK